MVQYSLMLAVIVSLKKAEISLLENFNCYLFSGDKPRLMIAAPRTTCSLQIVAPAQLGGSVRDDEASGVGVLGGSHQCWHMWEVVKSLLLEVLKKCMFLALDNTV